MPTAIYLADRQVSIDGVAPSTALYSADVGVTSVGGSKAARRRALLRFDLSGPADSGPTPPLGPGAATITSVTLTQYITSTVGSTGWPMKLFPLTRTDWAGFTEARPSGYPICDWNNYIENAVPPHAPWTTAGGDYDAAHYVAVNSPANFGLWTVNMTSLITTLADTHLIAIADSEANTNAFFSAGWGFANHTNGQQAYITVTYDTHFATVDERDPAMLTGEPPRRAVTPAGVARPASGARPARPRGR